MNNCINNTLSACRYLINYCINYCDNARKCYCECLDNDDQYNSLCVYKDTIDISKNMNVLILCISLTVFICIFCTWCKIKLYNSYTNPRLTNNFNNFDNYSNNILHPNAMTQETRTYLQYPDYQTYVYEYNHNEESNNENNENNQNDTLPKYTEINLNDDTELPPPPEYLYVSESNHSTTHSTT